MTDSHTFILHPNRADIRQNCYDCIRSLPNDKTWKVIVGEYTPDRTTTKNAEYFGYILRPAAEQLGYESVYDLHRLICIEIFGAHKVAFAGKTYELPNRTTTHPTIMNKKEFSDFFERASALLIEQGVVLPAPETWFA